MTSRLITPQLAEQFKQYPLYSQDGKKKDAICQIKQDRKSVV